MEAPLANGSLCGPYRSPFKQPDPSSIKDRQISVPYARANILISDCIDLEDSKDLRGEACRFYAALVKRIRIKWTKSIHQARAINEDTVYTDFIHGKRLIVSQIVIARFWHFGSR